MKHLILGDTHGRPTWKKAAAEDFDMLVFLGDYFDSWDFSATEEIHNFREICQFKRDNPDRVTLLIGNHDFHYMPTAMSVGESYSGFKTASGWNIREVLEENMDLLQMAYRFDKWLCTHAGVTKTWLNKTLEINPDDKVFFPIPIIDEYINDVFKHSPRHFLFNGNEDTGDDITQSPIWVRPASLMSDALDNYKQIVGHTRVGKINPKGVHDQFFFCDTLDKSSSGEFLVIEDGVVSTLKTR
jgi:predicted phosphodiesterase